MIKSTEDLIKVLRDIMCKRILPDIAATLSKQENSVNKLTTDTSNILVVNSTLILLGKKLHSSLKSQAIEINKLWDFIKNLKDEEE
jgi:hypothetical protein